MTIRNLFSTHDVMVAYCLAMAEARVRFPLGACWTWDPTTHCEIFAVGMRYLALNQEVGVRVLVGQRSIRCDVEAYFRSWFG